MTLRVGASYCRNYSAILKGNCNADTSAKPHEKSAVIQTCRITADDSVTVRLLPEPDVPSLSIL